MNKFIVAILKFFLSSSKKKETAEVKPKPKKYRPPGTVVASEMVGPDIEFMYNSKEETKGICPTCSWTKEKIPDLNYKMTKKLDVGVTFDGFFIVSEKFKTFCDSQHFDNLTFLPLNKSVGYYFFMPNEIFEIRSDLSHVRVDGEKCPCCGNYSWRGISHIYSAKKYNSEDNFIARLDGYFGDTYRKHPVVVIGLKTKRLMKAAGMKLDSYHNVYYLK